MAEQQFFTAAEIALGLGVTRTRGKQLMAKAPNPQPYRSGGNETKAWAVKDFSPRLRERLAELARKAGCRDVVHFLDARGAPWQPEFPISEIEENAVLLAESRRDMCAPFMRKYGYDALVSVIARAVVDRFERDGEITERSARRWIARAKTRDNGREEWERTELWLDDKITRRTHAHASAMQPGQFDSWEQCCFFLENQIAAGMPCKAALRELRKQLKGTALVGDLDAHAIRITLDRKWQRWKDEGKLSDKRKGNSGRCAKFELSDEEKNALRFLVLKKESFALAIEKFSKDPACQPAVRALILNELDRAARLGIAPQWPLSLRRAAHVTEELKAMFRGKKAFANVEMCSRRGMFWEAETGEKVPMVPNAIWESDDMSVNEPFRYHDPETGELRLGRQTLCTLDVYSCAWIGVTPIGRERDAYRMEDIADHLRECVLENGLPLFWRFERGLWENAVIDGIVVGKDAEGKKIRWGGLDAICNVIHVFKAKGKGTIETSFNLLQKLLAHESTTIGRTRGEFECATKLFLKAQQSGDVKAISKFWDIATAADGMGVAMQEFNSRQKKRHGHGKAMVVPDDLYRGAIIRPCPQDELWRFCPIKRIATVRRGFIQVAVKHYPNPFLFYVNGVEQGRYFETGYNVLIAFHPGRPEDGCHVFNAEQGTRNRDNIPFGEKLLVAPLYEDAPQVSLATRNKCNPVVRSEFRSIVPVGSSGSRISVARDGRGNSIRREEGRAHAISQQSLSPRGVSPGSPLVAEARRAKELSDEEYNRLRCMADLTEMKALDGSPSLLAYASDDLREKYYKWKAEQ